MRDLIWLYQLGFNFPKIIISSVISSHYSKLLAPGVALTEEEINWLRKLKSSGIDVRIQQTPEDEMT
ncbi:PTS sugar transporter subunit IIB [Aerococcaceae bacterium WGS1372]